MIQNLTKNITKQIVNNKHFCRFNFKQYNILYNQNLNTFLQKKIIELQYIMPIYNQTLFF